MFTFTEGAKVLLRAKLRIFIILLSSSVIVELPLYIKTLCIMLINLQHYLYLLMVSNHSKVIQVLCALC